MKILHVLSQRPDSTGSGMYVQAMIREAEVFGYQNHLVAGVNADDPIDKERLNKGESSFAHFRSDTLPFLIPGMSDIMPYESSRFCDLSDDEISLYEGGFTTVLKSAVDTFEPDIIHSHHLWLLSSLTRRLFPDIPLVTTCHGSDLRQFQNHPRFQERVLSGSLRINRVLALSKAQKRDIVRLYGIPREKITITGAGYNETLFFTDSKPGPDPVQIVYAGKLSNAKGVPWLLRALREITTPAWHLHLVGSGSGVEMEQCLQLAEKLGKKVTVHGAVPQKELADIMKRAHIFVLPSFFEGLPLVVLEGLACGCRVVATNLPGIEELLDDIKTNFVSLVETPRLYNSDQPVKEDEEGFEERLKTALQDQVTAAAKNVSINMAPIQEKLDAYTWKGVFKRVNEVYLASLS